MRKWIVAAVATVGLVAAPLPAQQPGPGQGSQPGGQQPGGQQNDRGQRRDDQGGQPGNRPTDRGNPPGDQGNREGQPDQNQPVSDQEFLTKAAQGGLFEVNTSVRARAAAGSPQVRQLAQRMFMDHSRANEMLLGLAQRKRMQVSTTQDKKHQDMIDRLSKLSGSGFDQAYLDMQLKAHQEAVQLFENAAKNLKDNELKNFAAQTLPILRMHLQMVQQMTGQPGGAAHPGGGSEHPGG